jgi:hypothetical protein
VRTRNLRRRALIVAAILALCLLLIAQTATYQVGREGWRQFIFRGPGVGATAG